MAFRKRLKKRLKGILRQQGQYTNSTDQSDKEISRVKKPKPETLVPPQAPSMELRIDPVPTKQVSKSMTTDVTSPTTIDATIDNKTDQDISIKSSLEEEWESDYISNDSPIRNAHYSAPKKDTNDAVLVTIIDPNEGNSYNFSCEPDEFILDAADRAGRELPFSCRSGGCLVCTGKLQSGSVNMEEQYVLEQEHIDSGFILLCCTTPQSDVTIESHQEDNVE